MSLLIDDMVAKMVAAIQGKEDAWDSPEPFDLGLPLDPVSRITADPLVTNDTTSRLRPSQMEQGDSDPLVMDFSTQKSTTKTRDEYQDIGAPAVGVTEAENKNTQGNFNADRWMKKYQNGQIPISALTPIEKGSHFMRKDAANAWKAMNRAAKRDGVQLVLTDSYRTYDSQVDLKKRKPTLAATPGTSNHGWGIANDVNVNDPKVHEWLKQNGAKFGYQQPMDYEPWHWEYHGGFKPTKKSPRPQNRQRPQVKGDPLNRVTSTDSLIFAPTVFGNVIREVTQVPQNPQELKDRESKANLGFVPKRYREMFRAAAEKYGIPAGLLASMAQSESGFDPEVIKGNRTSSAGAVGMMQVMPLHQETYGSKFMRNVRENIMVGAAIFSSYLNAAKQHPLSDQYGTLKLGLAMYNAGVNADDDLLISRISAYSNPILERWRG